MTVFPNPEGMSQLTAELENFSRINEELLEHLRLIRTLHQKYDEPHPRGKQGCYDCIALDYMIRGQALGPIITDGMLKRILGST